MYNAGPDVEVKQIERVVVFFAVLAHLAAALQFRLEFAELGLPGEWVWQFHLLLGLSLAASVVMYAGRRNTRVVLPLIFLQTVLVAILGMPGGAYLGVELTLFAVLVVQSVGYLVPPYHLAVAAAEVGLALLLQQPLKAWGRDLPRPVVHDLLALGLYLAQLVALTGLLRSWATRGEDQARQIRRLDEAIHQLTSANVGFQQYADLVEARSAADERKRITREVHDTVGYTLINVMMMLQEAALLADGNESLRLLHEQARQQAQTGLNETRRALRLLRAADLPPAQPLQAIRRIAGAFQAATGVQVNVEYGNLSGSLGGEAAEFVLHMLQEGMANAFRHGKATEIRVSFWQDDRRLIVNLTDNGSGSAGIEEGIGLSGMKERAEALRGEFQAGNIPNGFQITARIPVPAAG